MIKDLTVGKPMKRIIAFTIPVVIGNIFQQLYSIIDTLIVGRTLGLDALAAVGATGAISFLIIGFIQGITAGFAVITAKYFGAHDEAMVRKSVGASMLLAVAVTVVMTAVAVLTAMPLLKLMATPDNIITGSYQYIVAIFYGIFATVFYNLFSNILRALGDSRTPLIFLIVATLINIVLDYVFIAYCNMGVAGAGWATVVAQAVSALLCLVYSLKKFEILRLKKSDFVVTLRFMWEHVRVGLPMAFQFSITAIGMMVVQSVLNGYGSLTVAAYTAASKIDSLIGQTVLMALGVTAATFAAQNYGAKQYDRIRQGIRDCMKLGVMLSVFGLAFVILAGKPLMRLFVENVDPALMAEVEELGMTYLILNAAFYILLAAVFVYRNALQGMERSAITMLAGVAELAMRSASTILLGAIWGYAGICVASPMAWLGADILLLAVYLPLIRRLMHPNRRRMARVDVSDWQFRERMSALSHAFFLH